MKPLNLRHYYLDSIKQVLPQVLLLNLKIALFIFLCSIGFAVAYGIQYNSSQINDRYVSITFDDAVTEEREEAILNDIRMTSGYVNDYQGLAVDLGMCKLIMFNTFCWTYYVDSENLSQVLVDMNGQLIEGKLPDNKGEAMISDALSRSLEKGVGDTIGEGETLNKNYVVTGIYKGDTNLYIINDLNTNSYILKANSDSIDSFTDTLDQYDDELTVVTNREEINEFIVNIVKLLSVLGFVILMITAIEVTISVSNLNRVYFSERASEFALLLAVGYDKKFILKRVEKELGLFIFVGLIGGIILGQIMMILFYYLYCFDKGIPYRLFEPGVILLSIVLSVIIYIFSYFPTKKLVKNMNYVEVLQKNNA